MDSKQAIELIRETSLIPAEYREQIAELIERQERMIENAIDVIQEDSGDCPLNAGCCCIEDENCPGPCPLDGSDEQAEKCWRRWLKREETK